MTITLSDLLQIILYLVGIAALVYLALILKNVFKITGKVKSAPGENEAAINDTVKRLPFISNSVDKISTDATSVIGEVNGLVTSIKLEAERLSSTIGEVTDTVDDLTGRVNAAPLQIQSTLTGIPGNISDATKAISVNASNVIGYFYILREVIEALKGVFLK